MDNHDQCYSESKFHKITAQYIEYEGEELIIGFARDITERKEVENKLKKANNELENALSKLKQSQLELNQAKKKNS